MEFKARITVEAGPYLRPASCGRPSFSARFIMKKYRGHRCVPEFVGAELDTMPADMEKELAD